MLDTNVLVAAFATRGTCHELLEHVTSKHQLVLSPAILDEFQAVPADKFHFPALKIHKAIRLLKLKAELTTPVQLTQPVCRDPDDDRVIATAVAGVCDWIVSGDKDLTHLKKYHQIEIGLPLKMQ